MCTYCNVLHTTQSRDGDMLPKNVEGRTIVLSILLASGGDAVMMEDHKGILVSLKMQ